ncbi:type IV pilin N-terminal domain-containing protein [Halosimplex rubrum]|uniref:Type IV pilin N-terminal domain-containing protein n=1 Tax=Halosimplex rubrum TaxID=869889 RepID=A0A7D5PCG7_9EURY|nr:type IV pilin N-terminal domain-containing protein [Halosimplex rubrum]QLH79299.1 type IV pilin N-terminal domain-containing protein [Halosimplex rubrum]
MKLNRLLNDDDAVSPVIGVILMVAITVILAAVIATFVLGLGDQVSNTSPQASFSFEWDGASGEEGTLTITHDGGDTIQAQNLYVRGSDGSVGGADDANLGQTWDSSDYGGGVGATSEIQAGMNIDIDKVGSDGEISLVWQSSTGESSTTLKTWTGPTA